ncbi:MAG: hypothetical protein V2J55_03235 [Candidatus Competibacteraceae bacterium]|jgi:adenylate cyclase|nr:hypothetical protein [Candidatus Competibacteraceae bacterium]
MTSNLTQPATNPHCIRKEDIHGQLARLGANRDFKASERLRNLLQYLCERTLEGQQKYLTQRHLAQEVFGKNDQFDPELDAIVRIEIGKLRRALDLYYATVRQGDEVRIKIPKGSYVPQFIYQRNASSDAAEKSNASFRPTLAVIPLINLSADPNDAFFADGLTEELVVILTKLPELQVTPCYGAVHATTLGNGLIDLSDRLGVRFLLQGTVRRSDSRIRITARLYDAVRRTQIWANQYERNLITAELLDVQDGIAQEVSSHVADMYCGAINQSLADELGRNERSDLKVYAALLRFYHWLNQHTDAAYEAARAALEQAISIEPKNPLLMGMLADTLRAGYAHGYNDEPNPLPRVLQLAQQALSLAPNHPLCRLALCYALLQARRKAELLAVIEPIITDGQAPPAYVADAAVALALSGEWQRGCTMIEAQLQLMQVAPHFLLYPLCLDAYRRGDYEKALAIANRFTPAGLHWRPLLKAAILGQLDNRPEAESFLAETLRLRPRFATEGRRYLSCFLLEDSVVDQLFEGLSKAGLSVRSPLVV